MKNKIFKILTLAVVSIMVVLCLASCGTFTCDLCGEEKSGKSHSASGMTVCDDCYNKMSSLIS